MIEKVNKVDKTPSIDTIQLDTKKTVSVQKDNAIDKVHNFYEKLNPFKIFDKDPSDNSKLYNFASNMWSMQNNPLYWAQAVNKGVKSHNNQVRRPSL